MHEGAQNYHNLSGTDQDNQHQLRALKVSKENFNPINMHKGAISYKIASDANRAELDHWQEGYWNRSN